MKWLYASEYYRTLGHRLWRATAVCRLQYVTDNQAVPIFLAKKREYDYQIVFWTHSIVRGRAKPIPQPPLALPSNH